jgi:hypothetical protein
MAVICAAGTLWTVPAAATGAAPQAELSIEPGSGQLSVTLEAGSHGFPAKIVSYLFRFGDGQMVKTKKPTVVHTYKSAGSFAPEVTETDALGNTATAAGTLEVDKCPAGSSCTETLQNVSGIKKLTASGPTQVSTPATVDLFAGPFQIEHCDPAVETDGAVTDSGFTGNLTVTVVYQIPDPSRWKTTCFASVVPFIDKGGKTVTSGALPTCSMTSPVPPCVEHMSKAGSAATKVLLIPPGDPTVGSL